MSTPTRLSPARALAETLRSACIEAALSAYEDASIRGLCREGAWEAAVGAMRRMELGEDVGALLHHASIRVREAMTPQPATIGPEDPISLAGDIMRLGRIRHLPVVEGDRHLCGLLSERDLPRAPRDADAAHSRKGEDAPVSAVMTRDVIVTTPDTLLHDAARVMLLRKLGCLPVVEDGQATGILTEADFVALAVTGGALAARESS